jgi:hypothetical protein
MIDWPFSETASALEIVWSVFNLIGIGASGTLLVRTYRKLKAAPATGLVGFRLRVAERIARRNFRDEGAKAAWHVAAILIGFYEMTRPEPRGTVEAAALLAGWLLVGMSGLLAISSVLNLRDDDWISQTLDRGRREAGDVA